MTRQLAAVLVEMLLCVLLTPAGGWVLYRRSDVWPEHTSGAIVRYLFDPFIALIVGATVAILAKNRASLLALLGLTPVWVSALLRSAADFLPDVAYGDSCDCEFGHRNGACLADSQESCKIENTGWTLTLCH
jgi:hypothetical protein